MRLAKSLVATGEIELMSTTILPDDRPSAAPLRPNSAASTCGVSGTIVMTTSPDLAASLPESQALPPAPVSSSGTGLMSYRWSSCPPLIRLWAMGRPMMPSPMKPTFMLCLPRYRRGSARPARQPAEPCGRGRLRLVLEPPPALVTLAVEEIEDEG